ncbi:MAG: T9SS type A sorting domain-containing protein [Flavipsychrobacter sp.]
MRPINSIQYAKSIILLFVVSFFSTMLSAQTAPPIQWKKSFGGTNHDEARAVVNTSDGGFMIGGFTTSSDIDITGSKGGGDAWVIKVDSNGAIQWKKIYGSALGESGYDLIATRDGNFLLAANATANGGDVSGYHPNGVQLNTPDVWIVKFDDNGNIIWQNCYGGAGKERVYAVAQTHDGGYAIVATTDSSDADVSGYHKGPDVNATDIWLIKIDSLGVLKWQRCLGGSDHDRPLDIIATKDKGLVIAGFAKSNDGDVTTAKGKNDAWVIKTDSLGTTTWQKNYGGTENDNAAAIVECVDGGYMLMAATSSNNGDVTTLKGKICTWAVRLNDTGKVLWDKSYGGSESELAKGVIQTPDSGFVFISETNSNDQDVSVGKGNFDWWIHKTDQQGVLKWEKSLGTLLSDRIEGITLAKDGYVCVGYMYDNSGDLLNEHKGLGDWVVVKLKENFKGGGGTTTISNNVLVPNIRVYPSPTSGLVNIELSQGYENAELKVYDMMGKLLQVNIKQQGAVRTVDLSQFASGRYTIQVIYGEQASSYKVLKQ